jgi:streptogramin lyase
MLVLISAPFTTAALSHHLPLAYGLDGEVTAALTEWTIPTPDNLPMGLALDPSGECCWFVESSGNKVVHFDPSADTFQEWTIPTPNSRPTSLALTTISGAVVVLGTETAKDKVFLFFPNTGMFREYTLPPDFGPLYISIEPEGPQVKAWFTGIGDSVGQVIYDPSLGTLRMNEIALPAAAGGGAKGVHATSDAIWFAGMNAIVKWESATKQFTTYTIPRHPSTKAAFVDIDSLGQVWYTIASTQTTSASSYVGVLQSDNMFTEWQLPTPGANAQAISINPLTQNPWIMEQGEDKVAKLDPSGGGIITNAQTAKIRYDPVGAAVFTHVAGPVLPSIVTVTPTTSTPTMTSDEHFQEWSLEAEPQDMVVDASGKVWILESSSKVARLSLASNFVVGCDPSSLSVIQGANVTSTCMVTSVDGFSSTVQLAGSWLGTIPDGVAYTLPSPVTPPPGRRVSSTLIILAGPAASTGTYKLRVRGSSGALNHTTEVEVTIAAGIADFAIVISPSYLSIPPGGFGSATITVQSLGVFSSPVQLTGSGMPGGMALVFDPNPVRPYIGGTATSTATINLSGAPQGTYTLTISGSDGTLTRSTTLTVQVTGGCLIATATYGSELSDEVQLLRNFRDKSILTTRTGSGFMIAFDAWYYSFSPVVAAFIREHPTVRTVVKLALYPLIGILRIGEAIFHLVPASKDTATVITGLVVSSLIGSVYLSVPLAAVFSYSAKARRVHRKLVVSSSVALLLALITTALAVTLDAPVILMIGATSAIVLTSLAVSALTTSRAIMHLLTTQ